MAESNRCVALQNQTRLMHTWNEVDSLIEGYLRLFPDERLRLADIAGWLARNRSGDLFSRKNFDGHITTSAFIIDPQSSEMLLLKHKTLGKWFQPGGHTEGDGTLAESALREAVEETGIPAGQLRYVAVSGHPDLPHDIDSHFIPPNEKKQEPGHYHHDFRYVFLYSGQRDNAFNTNESTGMKWLSFDMLSADPVFSSVVQKISGIPSTTL